MNYQCLLTKLPSVFEGGASKKFNELEIRLTPNSSVSSSSTYGLTISTVTSSQVRIHGGQNASHFISSQGQDLGQEVSITSGSNTLHVSNGSEPSILYISNKSSITGLALSPGTNFTIYNTDLSQLKYCNENFTTLSGTWGSVQGNLSELSEFNLTSLSLAGSRTILGDLSDLENSTNLAYISLVDCFKITGNVLTFSSFSNLGYFGANSLLLDTNQDLSEFRNLNNLYKIRLTSSLPMRYSSHVPTRSSDQVLTAFYGVDLGTDVDNYLIDNSLCKKYTPSSTEDPNLYTILLKGTRTSASDGALQAIKNLGYTVILNGETL